MIIHRTKIYGFFLFLLAIFFLMCYNANIRENYFSNSGIRYHKH
nr:MAG TPA: hypothetical protein [Caudoviricetes sp.]